MVKTIEWKDGRVVMLDQSRLPCEVRFIECADYRMVADAIRKLWIRGAPAIGIAAAMGIALGAQEIRAKDFDSFMKRLQDIFETMLSTRPTAVNIRWAVERLANMLLTHRQYSLARLKKMLIEEAKLILREDIQVNRAIGRYGAGLIRDGSTILTHCNAGALATGGYGTATAPMRYAKAEGKKIRVYADETRPVLQGARLTAWELMQEGIPVTLITDNAAGALMQRGEIDLVIVGTDRTVRNGDVANKIGTYTVAVLAKENRIPFYVAAPLSSIDLSITTGEQIPIEERDPSEVTSIHGRVFCFRDKEENRLRTKKARAGKTADHKHMWGSVRIAPEGMPAKNLAFDVTPHRYVTGIITEKGVFRPSEIKNIMERKERGTIKESPVPPARR